MNGENNRRTSEKTAGDDPVSGTFKERSDTMGSIKSERTKNCNYSADSTCEDTEQV